MKNTATGGKLLILYGEFGAGHRQAAKALVEANHVFRTFDEAVEINIMEILHPRLHSLESRLYVKSIQKFPDLYDYLFHKTRWNSRLNSTLEHLKWFSERRLLELLKQEQPSAVVSTFPLASAAVAGLKSDGLTDVPLVTVITDYTCHSLWVHPQTDLYAVAAEPVRKALIKSGVPEHRVIVSGIPVAPRFSVSKDKTALRRKHRLHPSDPVVLVMGGGCGLMQRDLLKGLNRPAFVDIQWVLMCGNNRKQEKSFAAAAEGIPNIHVKGFVKEVDEWMALSDLLVSKPGGMTVSEALVSELPMLLYRPLPGQEKENARFLAESGAARMASDSDELWRELEHLLYSPLVRNGLIRHIRRLKKPDAAFHILLSTAGFRARNELTM